MNNPPKIIWVDTDTSWYADECPVWASGPAYIRADLVDGLAKAMNAMLTHMGMDEDEWNKVTFDQARAALKALEEE